MVKYLIVTTWKVECENEAEIFPICEDMFSNPYFDECKQVVPVADSVAICKLEYCLKSEPAVVNRIIEDYMRKCRNQLPVNSEFFCDFGSKAWYHQLFLDAGLV